LCSFWIGRVSDPSIVGTL